MAGRVLVTGGSGYVAGYCIARLLQDGWTVRATLRDAARGPALRETLRRIAPGADGIEVAGATLDADAGWAEAVAGCEAVLHVASPLPTQNPKDDDELVRPARDGALRVLRAARDAGVKRVVMTSSTAAIAYGHGGREAPFTEADWSDETNRADTSAYERSKTIAERAAWDWTRREGGALELAVVNPGLVLGPVLSADFSASVEAVKKLVDGSMPGLARFGWPVVDVRDIADLHVRAMTAPAASGERFIGAGEFTWLADMARVVRERVPALARKVPRRVLPSWLVRLAATLDPVVRDRLFELDKRRPVSAAKARELLGWVPRPAAESVAETAESLLREGVVRG